MKGEITKMPTCDQPIIPGQEDVGSPDRIGRQGKEKRNQGNAFLLSYPRATKAPQNFGASQV